jgi:Tol biopolymer transport system component
VKIWIIAGLLLGGGIGDFQGPSGLASSIKDVQAELLVYSSNGNEVGLVTKGSIEPLALNTHLAVSGGCCLHPATPSLSPDGRRIAYVHLSSSQPRREGINIYDHDSRQEKEVFQANLIWAISWAPSGDRLAVVADTAGDSARNLYLIDLQSITASRLNHGTLELDGREYTISNYTAPSWNGAGNQLAFEVRIAGALAENSSSRAVAVWDLLTNQVHKLAEGNNPSWSQAKDVIAFFEPSRQKCFTVRPDGSEKKLLFALGTKGFHSQLSLLSFPVVWSPDGNQLIFHQWVDADLVTDVYRLDLQSGKLKLIGRSEVQVVDWRETK